MKTSVLLSYCLLAFLSTVVIIESAAAFEQNDKLILQQLLNPDSLMAKRRAARELFGKRGKLNYVNIDKVNSIDGSDYYGRNIRRAKELFGKRSAVQAEDYDGKFQSSPEWAMMKNLDDAESVNRRPSYEIENEKLASLLNILMHRRDRRARSNELLG